jgi:septal ring factor EnvC (AmiA/AmiB activator)
MRSSIIAQARKAEKRSQTAILGPKMTAVEVKLDAIIKQMKPLELLPGIQKEITQIRTEVDTTKTEIHQMNSSFQDMKKSIEYTQEEVKDLAKTAETLESRVQDAETQIELLEGLKMQNKQLLDKITSLEDYSRRDNMIFDGVDHTPNENCTDLIYDILINKLKIPNARESIRLVRSHRLKAGRHP